jgi:4-hydroxyphenylpyruvate dioxygenase-like putative hemolysin
MISHRVDIPAMARAAAVSDGDRIAAEGKTGRQAAFRNSDGRLLQQARDVAEHRRENGLEGLVGDLAFAVINVEPANLVPAVGELLAVTGYDLAESFDGPGGATCVLRRRGSADIVMTARRRPDGAFDAYNNHPKSSHLPRTRLETFCFMTKDVAAYREIQSREGVKFLPEPPDMGGRAYARTVPSRFTGVSVGVVEGGGDDASYMGASDREVDLGLRKPDRQYLAGIGRLDHTATRVRAEDRDAAILEFMRLTNFNFQFAIYVERLNSITNVSRLESGGFAMVFTSGISPVGQSGNMGPTEKYIQNYGTRVHHLAFEADDIDVAYASLKADGCRFLTKLFGSREEGLKQAFSVQSPATLLVNEYIHRYDGFDGFFTKSNVAGLTRATAKQ